MAKTKRSYAPEFRADAVRLVIEQGRSVADVARGLDVHVNTLHGWVRDAKEAGGPPGSRRRSPE
jgi:transposase